MIKGGKASSCSSMAGGGKTAISNAPDVTSAVRGVISFQLRAVLDQLRMM